MKSINPVQIKVDIREIALNRLEKKNNKLSFQHEIVLYLCEQGIPFDHVEVIPPLMVYIEGKNEAMKMELKLSMNLDITSVM